MEAYGEQQEEGVVEVCHDGDRQEVLLAVAEVGLQVVCAADTGAVKQVHRAARDGGRQKLNHAFASARVSKVLRLRLNLTCIGLVPLILEKIIVHLSQQLLDASKTNLASTLLSHIHSFSLILPFDFLPTAMVNWPAEWRMLSGSSMRLKIFWSLRTHVKAYLLN